MKSYWVIDNKERAVAAISIKGNNVNWMVTKTGIGGKKKEKLMSFCSEIRNALMLHREIQIEEDRSFWVIPQ